MTDRTDRRAVERRHTERRRPHFPALAALRGAPFGAEIIGYRIEAADGYVGRAADFCIEEESWVVTGLIATTRQRTDAGKPIFVPLNAIERIDERKRTIYVTPTREAVRRGSRRGPR